MSAPRGGVDGVVDDDLGSAGAGDRMLSVPCRSATLPSNMFTSPMKSATKREFGAS